MVDAGGTVDADAAGFELAREGVEQLIGAVDGFLRTAPPLAAHVAVLGDFGVERGFFGGNVAIICAAHDDVAQGVPFVPAFDFGFIW
jgi:hypothetical protein